MYRRGFATAGVREITAAAGVSQGSFTNHFRSKEEFGLEVADRYFDAVIGAALDTTLRDPTRQPVDRIEAYFDTITAMLDGAGWQYGCLLGNMALAEAGTSEAIRARLIVIFAAWTAEFAAVLRLAQAAGDVRSDLDPDDAAEFLLAGWHGSMLRMKVDRNRGPLDRFRRLARSTVLTPSLTTVQSASSQP